jgi:Muramidase (flagellum-specific)
MIRPIFITLFVCISLSQTSSAQPKEDVIAYIEQYKQLAIAEQIRSGVPAAVKLAQGIYETAAGKSELSTLANNHFGIKCKTTWKGETFLHDDDKAQECFRKYPTAESSYIDHSNFLRGSTRYAFLFELEITDYIGWSKGLKKAGYATNPLYEKKLTELIERYDLQQYTYQAIKKAKSPAKNMGEIVPEKDVETTEAPDPLASFKGLKGFWAKKGESLTDKALMYNLKYAQLLAYMICRMHLYLQTCLYL